jgi:hypothetical protein
MHDPLVVAFEIRRPWPTKRDSTGWRHWPSLITVWHREPGGHDSGDVCKHYIRVQDPITGEWRFKFRHGWRFHIHHWKIQVPALQELRRRLLTRCTWCGGRSRKGDAVNVSHSWDGPRSRWWQGERGLYHGDCSGIASAHAACVCEAPITDGEGYGSCARCGKYRAFGRTEENLIRMRELAAIPRGQRGRRP